MVEVESMEHHALVLALDPALAGSKRAIHRAVQRRPQDRVGRAIRHVLGLRDEGRGCIVDHHIERRFAPYRVHHRVDRGAITDVATHRSHLAAGRLAHLDCSRFEQLQPAPADDELRAELEKTASHRSPEPGAATRDQNAFALQQALFKHRLTPPNCARRIVGTRQIRHGSFSLPCPSESRSTP
jgi:hypothetical protein